jgi:hypothetical protein
MMKTLLFAAFALSLSSGAVLAGEAKVSFTKLDDFSDIKAGNENKERFRERLTEEFTSVFSAFAEKLPEGYQLIINVTDIDLAGDIRPGMVIYYEQVRLMKQIDWPRIQFTYELKNTQQEVVASGKEELRDMDYLRRFRIPSGRTSFEFEEKMLQDWFKQQVVSGAFPSQDLKAVTATK